MSFARTIPNHLRRRREKVFGDGRPRPLDREAKLRIMTRARTLKQRTEKGKHYGLLTAKCLDVLEALLWSFHNARSGLCFPSLEKIAEKAKVARSTVSVAIKALEDAGLLSWVNRIVRVKDSALDLFGHWVNRWRILRTSNGYTPAVLSEMLGIKPGEIRALFKQTLEPDRAREVKEQMLAAGLPV